MKLVINISGQPLSQCKEIKNDKNIYEDYAILSPYKGAEGIECKSWNGIPYSYRDTTSLSNAFWITNFFVDNKINDYHKIEKIKLIYTNLKYHENNDDLIGEVDIDLKDIRTPIMSHYFGDTYNYLPLKESLEIWESARMKDNSMNKFIEKYNKNDEHRKQFARRLSRVYNNNDKNKEIINGGNEGILYFLDGNHKKIIKESIEISNIDAAINKDSEKKFGCEVISAINDIDKFYNFDIKNISDEKIKFEFENILLPTGKIQYSMLINSLKKQKDMKILIDDNKIENYAKYFIGDTKISKTIFSDIGIAFIKFQEDENHDNNFFGIIRDNYYLGKNHKHHNCRKKIQDRRVSKNLSDIKDKKFKIFHDLVMDGYKKENWACELNELPKYGKWKFCEQHVNTVTKRWDKESDKYLNLKNLYEDEIIECNCKKLLSIIKNRKRTQSHQYDDTLSFIHDGWEIDFGPKLIALLTTTGERDIERALSSIENQIHKVDEIVIASEKEIKSKYKTYINPYQCGLARNTMQALLEIRKENTGKVYVATLDDDDEWKSNYIESSKKEIQKKSTFITCPLEVHEEGSFLDTWSFNKDDVKVQTFLYGNCGVQGSNKIFDLDIALESGGMPKNINASTDRSFNINMLQHPDTKVSVLKESLVIFNKDKRPDRITNNPKRLNELKKFYKHFWAMIDKSKITEINERHNKLHGFEKVITWK